MSALMDGEKQRLREREWVEEQIARDRHWRQLSSTFKEFSDERFNPDEPNVKIAVKFLLGQYRSEDQKAALLHLLDTAESVSEVAAISQLYSDRIAEFISRNANEQTRKSIHISYQQLLFSVVTFVAGAFLALLGLKLF